MQEDDDGGYVGYVPSTVDPGPILWIVTLAITLFLLVILPFAVVLGDKYEERRKKRTDNSETDDDAEDETQAKKDGEDPSKKPEAGEQFDDDFSVSSKGTYISQVTDAMKQVLDNTGRPIRSANRQRHRRRYRGHLERDHLLRAPEQYSIELTNQMHNDEGSWTGTSLKDHSETAKEGDHGIIVSISGSIHEEQFMSEDISEIGCEEKVEVEKPPNSRNVCLTMDGFVDEIAAIMAWDVEMKRIIKLSIPFATQALFTGVLETLTVGIIGKLLGTREVSAFVIVNLLVELTTKFVGGFHEALATLCSQAIGAKKTRLAGKYVQISVIMYTLAYIPFAILWAFFLTDAIKWFGYDQETADMGQQYGYILLVDYLIDGLGEAIHGLLDVCGCENYSTFIGALEELTACMTILIWALVGSPSLLWVGIIECGMGVLFLSLNIIIIWRNGWFKPYLSGLIGTFALLDKKAVRMVCKTAASLSFGYLLTDGEWELLTVLASFLGPAEVTAWGIFGTIWDAINELIDGISDASEVRCAFLLGSGQPERARLSAYKSLMIGAFTSFYVTSILFMCGEDLATWMTNDPTLQHLLRDLLPMFGLGNAAMCIGTMAWTLLGAQGRYRLATIVVFLVSWFFTLPVAVVLTIHFELSLEGQTAAVVLGYIISGTIHAYFLFRSDWAALSESVMNDNCSRASDDDNSIYFVPSDESDNEETTALRTRDDDSSLKDVPTDLDNEETSECTPLGANEQRGVAIEAMISPSEPTLPSQRGNLPKPPDARSLVYEQRGLPSPPSDEGLPSLLPSESKSRSLLYSTSLLLDSFCSGEWQDGEANDEEVEVELYAGSG